MKVVLLAAGKGTRMMPLTATIPKPLIPVAGKPFLYWLLHNLKTAGATDVGIVVNYKKEMMEDWVKKNKHYFDMKISFINQPEPRGTGDAVKAAEDFVAGQNFVMVNGDDLYSPDDMARFKKVINDDVCYGMGYRAMDPTKYAVLSTDQQGWLRRIVEKPSAGEIKEFYQDKLVNANLWKFTPDIFEALKKIKRSERGEYEITSAVQLLADAHKVRIVPAKSYWVPFGNPNELIYLERFIQENF
ncbi:MAG: sugar phosphate nucleotidyltransferase [Candidatus Aenigmatarchaeota archaeon]